MRYKESNLSLTSKQNSSCGVGIVCLYIFLYVVRTASKSLSYKIRAVLSVLHQVCSVILLTVILHATICMSDTYSVPDHLFLMWAIIPDYHIINYPFFINLMLIF